MPERRPYHHPPLLGQYFTQGRPEPLQLIIEPWEASPDELPQIINPALGQPLEILNAISRGKNAPNTVSYALRTEVTSDEINDGVEAMLLHYGVNTAAQAADLAIRQCDIRVGIFRPRVPIPERAEEFVGHLANGHLRPEIAEFMGISSDECAMLYRDLCISLKVWPRTPPFLMRRAYEAGLRTANYVPVPGKRAQYAGFTLTTTGGLQLPLNDAQRDLAEDYSLGLSLPESAIKRGHLEGSQKIRARAVRSKTASPKTHTAVAKLLAIGELPFEPDARVVRLTARYKDIIPPLTQGVGEEEIAEGLHTSINTEKAHTRRLYWAIDARNERHAMRRLYQLGVFVTGQTV